MLPMMDDWCRGAGLAPQTLVALLAHGAALGERGVASAQVALRPAALAACFLGPVFAHHP